MCTPPTSPSESDGGRSLASQAAKVPSGSEGAEGPVQYAQCQFQCKPEHAENSPGRTRGSFLDALTGCEPSLLLFYTTIVFSTVHDYNRILGQRAADNTPATQPQHTLCFQDKQYSVRVYCGGRSELRVSSHPGDEGPPAHRFGDPEIERVLECVHDAFRLLL